MIPFQEIDRFNKEVDERRKQIVRAISNIVFIHGGELMFPSGKTCGTVDKNLEPCQVSGFRIANQQLVACIFLGPDDGTTIPVVDMCLEDLLTMLHEQIKNLPEDQQEELVHECAAELAGKDLCSDFIGEQTDGQTVYLHDTVDEMKPDDNQGFATTIVLDADRKTIRMNGLDPLVDDPLKKKEPWAFVWDCSHMSRDATDEEVLKAWENGPSPSSDDEDDDTLYEVEKLTPNELTERINDNECPFGQQYVRVIYV